MATAVSKSGRSSYPPNQTLYCTNLPDKIQKVDLRMSLYTLFSTYGPVMDVVALKTSKMRGQAHVVFRDAQTSTQAMRALQGFDFFGREMRIRYAKGKSDTIAKLDGTYRMPNGAAEVAATELQQSIFNAPPSSTGAPASMRTAARSAPGPEGAPNGSEAPHGVKRAREEESDGGEAPMSEDEGDAPMEEASDED